MESSADGASFEELENAVLGVTVEFDIDLRPQVVPEVHQFPPCAHWQEQHVRLLVHGQLRDGDGIREPFERAAQVERTGDDRPAARSPIQRPAYQCRQYRQSQSRAPDRS